MAAPSYTQGQVAASLAANPQASKGGYEGPGPLFPADGQRDPSNPQPGDPYDSSSDPILQKIHAVNVNARVSARAAAMAQAKQLAIRLGDATGFGLDDTAQQEAAGNPYSTLAQLLHGYQDTSHQHDEQLNQHNLFYSGTRVKTLADDANAYQGNVYNARNAALSDYGGIQAGLASALSGIDQSDASAEGDAYGRAQARALAYGYDPGSVTDNANTNVGAPNSAPAAKAPTYGQPQSSSFGGSTGPYIGTLPKALATPKAPKPPKALPNPYATGQKARG